ncbi:hypothetical protein BDV25DRAFT_143533 [Aspergillus avenaceus]|uniref:Uncharacterized protein n=1 Tax=Aspergillus avenaceus TaxID=36643 RepID=A0A5N6TJS6_ASPAV|nr:hypothetical protein BDV25DRAFT_143533 [Aspergillus avenaceus]
MAPLKFQNCRVVNSTEHSLFLSFPPASPLEIPIGKDLLDFSAEIEEIYFHNPDKESDDCYVLPSELSLAPGTVTAFVDSGHGLSLEYGKDGSHPEAKVEMKLNSHGHNLYKSAGATPLRANTVFEKVLGIADEDDAADAETMLYTTGTPGAGGATPGGASTFLSLIGATAPSNPMPKSIGGAIPSSIGGGGGGGGTPPPFVNVVLLPGESVVDPKLIQPSLDAKADLDSVSSVMMLLASDALDQASRQAGHQISPLYETNKYMQICANAYLNAPLSPALRGFLINPQFTNSQFNKTCEARQVHTEFLRNFAEEFKFNENQDAYKTLDKTLTEFSRSIASGNVDENNDLCFTINRGSLPVEPLPGSAFRVVTPKMKIFYISCAARTFTQIIKNGKSQSSVQKVNLTFKYTTLSCNLRQDLWRRVRDQYDNAMITSSGVGFNDLINKVSQTVVV